MRWPFTERSFSINTNKMFEIACHQQLRSYGEGPQLEVSSERLVKPGIEPANPGLQGECPIHYTTEAPTR